MNGDETRKDPRFLAGGIPPALQPLLGDLAAAPDRPQFDRFVIQEELGSGGMAVVYRAVDRTLNRPVALKLLRDDLQRSDSARVRFQREARAAARLNHSNVVAIHDVGEEAGRAFLVMELIRGETLAALLSRRQVELRPVLAILEKVARAVQHAHDQGIVHRDLKPGNILLTEAGEPKVGDFGLARFIDGEGALTRSGTIVGTPNYMAPEQVRGSDADISPRTDIYALGATLYEILTGRPPHIGENIAEVYARILSDDPLPPRRLNGRLPAELETICLKALEKDPERRYLRAVDFAEDLRRHLAGEPILAKAPGLASRSLKWAKRHRGASGMAAMGLLGVAAVAAALWIADARRRDAVGADVAKLTASAAAQAELRDRNEKELAGLRRREREIAAALPAGASEEERRPLWKARQDIARLEREIADHQAEIYRALMTANQADSRDPGVRRMLTGHHFGEYERAMARGELARAEEQADQASIFDDGTYRDRLRKQGSLALDTVPSGAAAELLRYEATDDLTLEARHELDLGICPLGDVTLATGSYLLILKKEGYRDVRLPLFVRRGTRLASTVNLYKEEEIGGDFVYVPGGPFIAGGDPLAQDPAPWDDRAATGDFFIGRTEVTLQSYLVFINDLIRTAGGEAALPRIPRLQSGGVALIRLSPDKGRLVVHREVDLHWPVMEVSWDDATAYCEWLTRGEAEAGGHRRFRLPTGAEWEKAARGVDGRFLPWGNSFERSFCHGDLDPGKRWQFRPVGSFPRDESPYGVLDTTGGVCEWCADADGRFADTRMLRGGGFSVRDSNAFRTCSRGSQWRQTANDVIGFRVVFDRVR